MKTSAYQTAHFIHENNVAVAIWHEQPFTPADGWDFSLDYPVLEIVQYPALPAWCQTSAESMAAFMLCDCDNEHLCTECQQEAERWHAHMDRTYLYS